MGWHCAQGCPRAGRKEEQALLLSLLDLLERQLILWPSLAHRNRDTDVHQVSHVLGDGCPGRKVQALLLVGADIEQRKT